MASSHRLGGLAFVVIFLAACSGEPELEPDAGHRRDAGGDAGWLELPDSGPRPDAGARPDGSATPDASESPDAASPDAGTPDASDPTRPIAEFWANTQWPPFATLRPGESVSVYGQVWVADGTNHAGAMSGLVAELGHGPSGSDHASGGWTWVTASFNVDVGNNDEYVAELHTPSSGPRDFAFRYRVEGAHWEGRGEWLYASLAGPDFASAEAGKLAVREPGAQLRVATLNLECLRDDPVARLQAAADRFRSLQVDAIALQEVCEDTSTQPAFTNSAEYLAQLLSTSGRSYTALFEQTHLANDTIPEGIGLVTAFPVAAKEVHALPTSDFPRKALTAVIATPVGMVAMTSTHFSFSTTAADMRHQQAQSLVAFADGWQGSAHPPGTTFVAAGDFNAGPTEQAIQTMTASFTDAWGSTHAGEAGFTFPSYNPSKRIDYVFVRAPDGETVAIADALVEFTQPYSGSNHVSDHFGVSARFSVAP